MSAPLRSLKTAQPARLGAVLLAFVIWALLAASALWWWLHAGSSAAAPEAPVAARAPADVDGAAVARALGADGAATPASAPATAVSADGLFALRGVLTHGEGGAALVAVAGKVRTVRVGAPVGKDAEGWTLHEALPHAVVLAGGGRQVRLEMPDMAERARAAREAGKQSAGAQTAPTAASVPAAPFLPASRIRPPRRIPDA